MVWKLSSPDLEYALHQREQIGADRWLCDLAIRLQCEAEGISVIHKPISPDYEYIEDVRLEIALYAADYPSNVFDRICKTYGCTHPVFGIMLPDYSDVRKYMAEVRNLTNKGMMFKDACILVRVEYRNSPAYQASLLRQPVDSVQLDRISKEIQKLGDENE